MGFLTLQNVCKGYGPWDRRTEVLRGINLEIAQGEFVAIVGFSGAGKTTLIKLIAGLIRPDHGSMTLRDREIREPGPDRGVVFQNYSLLPWLSVFENVLLAVDSCFPKSTAPEKIRQAERYLATVNLTAARDKRPPMLSGGMRQRVAVARALAMDPQILLLDEPLSALDALTRASLQDEIARIWQESHKTVVLITNDVDEGLYLADRIIPLKSGPPASLGPSFKVDLARPRDRKRMNQQPRYKAIRRELVEFLLRSKQNAPTGFSGTQIVHGRYADSRVGAPERNSDGPRRWQQNQPESSFLQAK